MIQYLKVPVGLLPSEKTAEKYKKDFVDDSTPIDLTVNELHKFSNVQFALNATLLREGHLIDESVFYHGHRRLGNKPDENFERGDIVPHNWVEHLHENEPNEKVLLNKLHDLRPVFFNVERIGDAEEFTPEFLKSKIQIYLYIKSETKDIPDFLNALERSCLKKYIAGQMSEGWGEGFMPSIELEYKGDWHTDFWLSLGCDASEYKLVDKITEPHEIFY